MKALVKLLLLAFGLVAAVRAQEQPSPTPSGMDEPALPNSKPGIPHPPAAGLLPVSGALPNPTPKPEIYSPIKPKETVVTKSTVKPPLRPKTTSKTQNKTQKRFEEVRSIAMRNPHVVYLLKQANKASTGSSRRSLMRAYYKAVCARMRLLEPGLKNSINAYQEEKTVASGKISDSNTKTSRSKLTNSKKSSHHTQDATPETHTVRHKHAYSHRVVYPSDYEPYGPYAPSGPYGPYGGYYGW
jgi:hypothetical protein